MGDKDINKDAVLRVCQRSDEVEKGGGVVDRDGVRARWDEAEQRRVGRRKGMAATWHARRVMLTLHMRHHFKHAAYTDASKGGGSVAGCVWEGVQMSDDAQAHDGDGDAIARALRRARAGDVAARERRGVGQGMWGVRLPEHWEICDAEM